MDGCRFRSSWTRPGTPCAPPYPWPTPRHGTTTSPAGTAQTLGAGTAPTATTSPPRWRGCSLSSGTTSPEALGGAPRPSPGLSGAVRLDDLDAVGRRRLPCNAHPPAAQRADRAAVAVVASRPHVPARGVADRRVAAVRRAPGPARLVPEGQCGCRSGTADEPPHPDEEVGHH